AIDAGVFTTLCILAGSFVRPIGGYLADRIGGVRLLLVLLTSSSVMMMGVAQLPPLNIAIVLLSAAMLSWGMGNGSIFQLVPLRFPKQVGLATGVVGAAGGLGGFLIPLTLGALRDFTGSYGPGLALFSLGGILAISLLKTRRDWIWAYPDHAVSLPPMPQVIIEARAYISRKVVKR
ncbi:MAG: MFS transporter, partial [Thaumarchaeota archaeon]|nr:MFS transporter [Nitrososphaerota archaeon]